MNEMTGTTNRFNDDVIEDLRQSGLVPEDLRIRQLTNTERAATAVSFSVNGFVIPYFNIQGRSVPFYRVKLYHHEPKYKQIKDSNNHIYFPPNFMAAAKDSPFIILTEGEKKAVLATKRGFPAVAVSGVDSWRNRIIALPTDVVLDQKKDKMSAKLPPGGEVAEEMLSTVAAGFQELLDYLIETKKHLIIVFDTDRPQGTAPDVQRAASALGFELRFRGIPFSHIRQIMLPQPPGRIGKIGLDDFLMFPEAGSEMFSELVKNCLIKRSAFPRHPSIRDFLNKKLQKAKMSRKETQAVAMSILSELDAEGIRLRSDAEQQSYYFDITNHRLLRAALADNGTDLAESPFGRMLYRRFGIGAADQRVLQWIGSQFSGEDPVESVTPHRIFARPDVSKDSVIYQMSDGIYAEVDSSDTGTYKETPGLHIHDNGDNGILFESGQVVALDTAKVCQEYAKQYHEYRVQGYLTPWWMDVLAQVRLKDRNRQRTVTALLFYMSPWLSRWRGTQLPMTMVLGEAGSGKSSLFELQLQIQTGIPKLRNSPQDIKDWHASVANTGGMHVVDNVNLVDKMLRQRLSDEICRIITEPQPSIEMRKYYTNADLVQIPVRCTFGITAIQQPFLNADVLQRSIIVELDKSKDLLERGAEGLQYDSNWMWQQLRRYGGREAWIAHHLLTLHVFFKEVKKRWDLRYSAKHRLINFEQAMVMMADLFKLPHDWIPSHLAFTTEGAVTKADWAFEGLKAYCDDWVAKHPDKVLPVTTQGNPQFVYVFAQEIANWAMGQEDFEKCEALTNTRKLGRYIQTHKTMIAAATGLIEAGVSNNRQRYRIAKIK